MTFKVGDKIRRCSDAVHGAPIGFETIVIESRLGTDAGRVWYTDKYGEEVHGDAKAFKLVSDSPVRTVTRQEIIPGTYDGVRVGDPFRNGVTVEIERAHMDPDRLTRAASVLTALAGALRDDR